MNKERITNVLSRLENADAVLVSDPMAIRYLCGEMIYPGERFLGLLLKRGQDPVLFLNILFPMQEIEGLKIVSYADGDDLNELLSPYIFKDEVLGIDKTFQARFLLPMQKYGLAKDYVDGSLAVDKTRAVKEKEELELLRRSSQINDAAMAEFKKLIHEGVSEKQVASKCLDIYKKLGADGFSFSPIVAFGSNSANPHHMPDDTILQEGDAVLFDVGCTYKGYCSDMTRTFFYKKAPEGKRKEVYELVRKANEEATGKVKAGVRLCDIDKTARDIIDEGGYGKFFTHRLGHFIGLEDHEYGDVSAAFKDLCEIGNVFSIEPGIYDPDSLGCRIEDLVVVTEEGCEVLNSYPHDIEIIY